MIAFLLILITSSSIYLIGRRVAPKPLQSDSERSSYACGENASFHGLKVNVSLYKFLIYFVIFDSSVLLLSFASISSIGNNAILMILYLFLMLASGLILLEGGRDTNA
ncbi:MAG TPA: NADH-quinone oxidoreductase subunit A [Candidatus Glassbacteria bacterium]|nr:NADH-quinone oxidoreductase subunit A [Candidatus Glassbacteria bacterium]